MGLVVDMELTQHLVRTVVFHQVVVEVVNSSRVKMNSINWPALNIWVFIAQLVEHCSANAEAMGSNSVKALKKQNFGLKFAIA